jgi:hypothetical protein
MLTKAELLAEREELGDKLAVALGQLDAILDRLNADLKPTKRKSVPTKTKEIGQSKAPARLRLSPYS